MKKVLLPTVLCLLLALWLILGRTAPEKRVVRYVEAHQAELQTAVDDYFLRGQHLSYGGDIQTANDWPGQHPMIEYLLFTTPGGYYGFYYSPDQIPLAFQNTGVPLVPSDGGWCWQGEGDNHGTTRLISPGWYFFEAHF